LGIWLKPTWHSISCASDWATSINLALVLQFGLSYLLPARIGAEWRGRMTMPVTTPIPNAIENILIQNVEAEIPGTGAQAICSAKGQACVDRASQATSGNWPQQSEHIAAVGEPAMSTATITDGSVETYEGLTEALVDRLSHPATSPHVDLKKGVNEVLVD